MVLYWLVHGFDVRFVVVVSNVLLWRTMLCLVMDGFIDLVVVG